MRHLTPDSTVTSVDSFGFTGTGEYAQIFIIISNVRIPHSK